MKRYCLALDLVDDPAFIAEYEAYHQSVWPEIKASILDSGITNMEIYRLGNRLFMIMDTTDLFSFEAKSEMDRNNPSTGMGTTHVEIPAGIATGKARGEMVADEQNIPIVICN